MIVQYNTGAATAIGQWEVNAYADGWPVQRPHDRRSALPLSGPADNACSCGVHLLHAASWLRAHGP